MPRQEHDFYETPPHYLSALASLLPRITGAVLEPCVGEGAISSWLEETHGCPVITNDIDPQREADWYTDARNGRRLYRLVKQNKVQWVITNPPFSCGFEILEHLFSGDTNYVFLARISFNEPTKQRGKWLQTYPPKFIQFLPRYSFRLNDKGKRQTDSVTCCWIGWGPDVPEGIFYSTERDA